MIRIVSKLIFTVAMFSAVLFLESGDLGNQVFADEKKSTYKSNLYSSDSNSDGLKKGEKIAVLAGGCFWGIEAIYEQIDGVRYAASGYTGGKAETANYKMVSYGETEHAEAVKVVYDPKKVSYKKLLEVFFSVAHNPTELNRQGPDIGKQYRSAVFYADDEQKKITENYISELTNAKAFSEPIVTQVMKLTKFYDAEDYHQNYMVNHPNEPYIVQNDVPKVKNLRKLYPKILKK